MKKESLIGLAAIVMSCSPIMKDKLARGATNTLGGIYLCFEKEIVYKDSTILGLPIDEELQSMSRKDLCNYIDSLAQTEGFYELPSTTKIRMGAQLFKEYHKNERDD
jgi:hypothetical protein|tara:strand:+ start:1374 stop:1694 length:321 start_codon:yes stop_codon:yes gene_type:complete